MHGQGRWRGAPQQENLQVIEEHSAAALEETLVAQHLGSWGAQSTAAAPQQPTQGHEHVMGKQRTEEGQLESLKRWIGWGFGVHSVSVLWKNLLSYWLFL